MPPKKGQEEASAADRQQDRQGPCCLRGKGGCRARTIPGCWALCATAKSLSQGTRFLIVSPGPLRTWIIKKSHCTGDNGRTRNKYMYACMCSKCSFTRLSHAYRKFSYNLSSNVSQRLKDKVIISANFDASGQYIPPRECRKKNFNEKVKLNTKGYSKAYAKIKSISK